MAKKEFYLYRDRREHTQGSKLRENRVYCIENRGISLNGPKLKVKSTCIK